MTRRIREKGKNPTIILDDWIIRAKLKGYLSVQETASKWGVSVRWVNQYILAGRIPDCERFGHAWAIPEDAVKPEKHKSGPKPKEMSERNSGQE